MKEKYPDVSISEVGVTFITPPDVTQVLIKDAHKFGLRHFLFQPETIREDTLQELQNEYKDVNFVQDNAVEYLYFDFFSDITNLESVSESRRKILHGLEWIEDEVFERGKLMK